MSYFSHVENQHQLDPNLDADYGVTAEQLLASLGEVALGDPPPLNPNETFRDTSSFNSSSNTAHGVSASDWNYGAAGLLNPLRRPDPSQIPPDVLALLVKTGQFSEMLNPEYSMQFGNNSNIQLSSQQLNNFGSQEGPNWAPLNNSNSNHQLNWSPQNMSGNTSTSVPQFSQATSSTPPQQNRYQSNLSPLATEFVPRQYSPQRQADNTASDEVNLLTLAIAEVNQNTNYDRPQQSHQTRNRFVNPHQNVSQQYRQQHSSTPHFSQQRGPAGPRPQGGFTPRQRPYRQPQVEFTPASAQPEVSFDFETNADRVLTFVVDTISYLTHDPANFNSAMKKIIRVLGESLTDSDTLEIMITLIVEQSITNRNFFSTGARMCESLNAHRIKAGVVTAQKCLIKHVQQIFTSALNSMPAASDELRERHIGILLFLAELFVRFKIEGKLFHAFGIAICEILVKFCECNNGESPNHELVKVVLNVFKLAGWDLDNHGHVLVKQNMETLMAALSAILNQENLPVRTKALVEKIFELRKGNWGREDTESTASNEATSKSPPSSVIYGGKEQENVYEEPSSSDEECGVYLDEEAEKCYDQFLSETQAKE